MLGQQTSGCTPTRALPLPAQQPSRWFHTPSLRLNSLPEAAAGGGSGSNEGGSGGSGDGGGGGGGGGGDDGSGKPGDGEEDDKLLDLAQVGGWVSVHNTTQPNRVRLAVIAGGLSSKECSSWMQLTNSTCRVLPAPRHLLPLFVCGVHDVQAEAMAAAARVRLPADMVETAKSVGIRSTALSKYISLQVGGVCVGLCVCACMHVVEGDPGVPTCAAEVACKGLEMLCSCV